MANIDNDEDELEFHEMGLDDRILKAIAKLSWSKPTPIQNAAIPRALRGKDILARARTGSGKTAAYAIPIIQKILKIKQNAREQSIKAVVLAPTKELCHQAYTNVKELSSSARDVTFIDVSDFSSLDAAKPLLMENPDILIGTPCRVLEHINAKNIDLSQSVEMVVIDEADLIFSFGYEKNMQSLLSHLPDIYQAFLMSATLSTDVQSLKAMILHNPVILKLNETEQLPGSSQLTQYHLKCEEADKFLLMYALLKFRLLTGKMIVFVNTVDRCYRLKLFLEQFSISSCVLNSELPVASRCHIVNQFNRGIYDVIIAADELALRNPHEVKKQQQPKNKLKQKDLESGVSRGIDFRHVSTVINFDFPPDVDSYIHRVGRTARGDCRGMALSLVCVKELERMEEVEKYLSSTHPEGIKAFDFNIEEIEGLRYRSTDAMRTVTKYVIKEARIREIKNEILNCKKLQPHLVDHPRDLQFLRHDKTLHSVQIKPHMKHVPEYLIPASLLPYKSRIEDSKKRRRRNNRDPKWKCPTRGEARFKKRQADPLKSFALEPSRKKRRTK